MASLTSVTLVTEAGTQIQYDAIRGIWVDVQLDEHVGYDTVEIAMPKLKSVKFGQVELSPKDWKAIGCPFMLMPNELATVQQVAGRARMIDHEKQIRLNL